MKVRAVLFDVGGPIDTEVISEAVIDRQIRAAVEGAGIAVSDGAYVAANAAAVVSFAPDAYRAIIWTLTSGEAALARAAYERFHDGHEERAAARDGIEMRAGMSEIIRGLHARGLLLGLAANQPSRAVAELDRHGIGKYFAHREVSGHHGYRKPDVRLFLRACEDLRVAPEECIMVGDRIDNDIGPAKLLGMRTVLLRTGRHIAQQPRSWDEMPDVEVRSVAEMEAAILALAGLPAG